VIRSGGRVAFCEPNAFYPLFYLQILLTPGMSFRGDGGIVRMRPGPVGDALSGAGFVDLSDARYGLFPPAVANTGIGQRYERRLERFPLLRPFLAFRVFSGRVPRGG
jgi:hypothetical protein